MTYEPGTVAVATVRGVPNVRVIRTAARRDLWFSIERHGHNPDGMDSIRWHGEEHVTDVRPLVVLDLAEAGFDPSALTGFLRRDAMPGSPRDRIADQIEAQTRPPKPAEPQGLGAVVKDRSGLTWVRRHPGGKAWVNGYERWTSFADIDAVEVLSPGVAS